jgi:hypothetical protein
MPSGFLQKAQTLTLPPDVSSQLRYGADVRALNKTPPGVPDYLSGSIEEDNDRAYHLVRLVFQIEDISSQLLALRLIFRLSRDCSPPAIIWVTYPRTGDMRDSFTTSTKIGAELMPFKAEAGVETSGSVDVGFVISSGPLTSEAWWDYRAGMTRQISGQIEVAVITRRPSEIECSATVEARLETRRPLPGSEGRFYSARLGAFNDQLALAF